MATLEEIKGQIEGIGGLSMFLGRREIKELPKILWEGENVEELVQGRYKDKIGVLVATTKRLIFIDKGILFGVRVEDFPFDKISSIKYETGMIYGKITIFASGNNAEIKNINKAQAKKFADHVRMQMSVKDHHNISPSSVSQNSSDIIGQLEKLAQLKQQGILTESEFLAQKDKLLKNS